MRFLRPTVAGLLSFSIVGAAPGLGSYEAMAGIVVGKSAGAPFKAAPVRLAEPGRASLTGGFNGMADQMTLPAGSLGLGQPAIASQPAARRPGASAPSASILQDLAQPLPEFTAMENQGVRETAESDFLRRTGGYKAAAVADVAADGETGAGRLAGSPQGPTLASPRASERVQAEAVPASPGGAGPRQISRLHQAVILGAVVLPFLGLIGAGVLAWGAGLSWVPLGAMAVLSALSGHGITVGFHRLFTHRSFKATRGVRLVLAVLGSMAVQGPILEWVGTHRLHHQRSDKSGDPHSPHLHGQGLLGVFRGLWHAHIGWLLDRDRPDITRYIPDLAGDPTLRMVNRLFVFWVALGIAIPTVFCGLVMGGWTGALLGFLWGGLARIFFVHHVTFSINSICHIWGKRPFRSRDESRNNFFFGFFGFGEGWHNGHHAFPSSAKHGLLPWQLDISYLVILGLKRLGLAWEIDVPTDEQIAAKRIDLPGPKP